MTFATTEPLGIALIGLLMGMRHATDPDHVIAVTTIVTRERRLLSASRIGAVWGLGHTATVLAAGALIILFKIAIPVRVGLTMEFAVALVLILLGLRATTELLRRIIQRGKSLRRAPSPMAHSHSHHHGGARHWHPHVHYDSLRHDESEHEELHRVAQPARAQPGSAPVRRPLLRSFGVGLVHGLAGSAAIALLVLSAIPQPVWATLYLVVFCCGTIAGMALITTVIAAPVTFAAGRLSRMHQGFATGAGLLSFGFGVFLAYQLGVVDHLFGAMPQWTPH